MPGSVQCLVTSYLTPPPPTARSQPGTGGSDAHRGSPQLRCQPRGGRGARGGAITRCRDRRAVSPSGRGRAAEPDFTECRARCPPPPGSRRGRRGSRRAELLKIHLMRATADRGHHEQTESSDSHLDDRTHSQEYLQDTGSAQELISVQKSRRKDG
ncbi:Krueppel-like factor 16 isoform X1 [Malaclemys terrapin pileata]|uniref:Krueppel-like factor 16 isoform X1 n=1 Tax=Malaclemys terrapin pileata TaxID=2991368 RepID=UPI0023A7934E|nr:Krueppel-like factor 16 isoform X1 [Malaclemys terrapin pileata]